MIPRIFYGYSMYPTRVRFIRFRGRSRRFCRRLETIRHFRIETAPRFQGEIGLLGWLDILT